MDRMVWFSLLLSYLPVTENKQKDESCLSQPNGVMWQLSGESAVLKCSVNSDCSAKGLQYEWFAFRRNVHLRLRPSNESLKYSLDGASLHIKSLHVNDSGIYHCAAVSSGEPAPGAQHVGLGTTLVVREQFKTMVRHILWVSCVLLATYSLAILILMIKKYGCNMSVCGSVLNTNKKNSVKRTQFRDVLQEMYSKRNLGNSKKTESRNRSQAEAASTEFKNSTDDVYQNVL
ncbi:immunoglobulin superfamily member 6 isoform X1 [Cyclopterus lumpus]|uniref:immunoglobulin superfamily member 6 isoform X1 n=1 Tax=Cyclopterus lumpus TaxID=8103 RepID=UPI001485CE74|nr:immunoglobulin superfamily member 6 isoform X1 [Cyclopterus lumpus]